MNLRSRETSILVFVFVIRLAFSKNLDLGCQSGGFLPLALLVPRGLSTTATIRYFLLGERYDGGGDDLFVSVALEHRRPKDGTTPVAPRFSRETIDETRSAEQRCHRSVVVVVVLFHGEVGESAQR